MLPRLGDEAGFEFVEAFFQRDGIRLRLRHAAHADGQRGELGAGAGAGIGQRHGRPDAGAGAEDGREKVFVREAGGDGAAA